MRTSSICPKLVRVMRLLNLLLTVLWEGLASASWFQIMLLIWQRGRRTKRRVAAKNPHQASWLEVKRSQIKANTEVLWTEGQCKFRRDYFQLCSATWTIPAVNFIIDLHRRSLAHHQLHPVLSLQPWCYEKKSFPLNISKSNIVAFMVVPHSHIQRPFIYLHHHWKRWQKNARFTFNRLLTLEMCSVLKRMPLAASSMNRWMCLQLLATDPTYPPKKWKFL